MLRSSSSTLAFIYSVYGTIFVQEDSRSNRSSLNCGQQRDRPNTTSQGGGGGTS